MAATLGQLLIDIRANSVRLNSDLGKASSNMTRFQKKTNRSLGRIDSKLKSTGRAIKSFAAAYIGAMSARAIIENTIRQENAIASLETTLKSTNNAVGITSQELQTFATSLQGVTTYGDEAILEMQSLLATFTQIKGENFLAATEAGLNIATKTGQSLVSVTTQLGKALNDPVKGIAALSRVGVNFTEQQKKLIQNLVKTGDVAKAQKVILQELEVEFGNSARAASETFGGALKQLQNAFGDLLELDTTSLSDAEEAIRELTKTLSDPKVKQSIDDIVAGIAKIANIAAKAITKINGLGTSFGELVFERIGKPIYEDIYGKGTGVGAPNAQGKQIVEAAIKAAAAAKETKEFFDAAGRNNPLFNGGVKAPLEEVVVATEKTEKNIVAVAQSTELIIPKMKRFGGMIEEINGEFTQVRGHTVMTAESMEKLGFYTENVAASAAKVKEPLTDIQQLGVQIGSTLSNGVGNALSGLVTGTKSLKDSLKDLLGTMAEMLIQFAVMQSFKMALGGTSMGGFMGFATGGTPPLGRPSIVGENGPELFVPNTTGKIIPNGQSAGGAGVTLNMTVNAGVSQTVRAEMISLMPQIKQSVVSAVADAKQRGGRLGSAL